MNNESIRVLLAEDDESDRLLFREAFSELKIKTSVQTTNNGMELMAYLNSKDVELPYLIFLDLNMPRKNGLECLKEIRSNEKLKDIFVAIYSTSHSDKDMDATFSHGANIYITKPTDFKKLKEVLEKAVKTVYLYRASEMKKEFFLMRI